MAKKPTGERTGTPFAITPILDRCQLPTTRAPALALLPETVRKPTLRVWAEQTAFELKDSLKRRGYRWNDGSDGRPKSWSIDVCETAVNTGCHLSPPKNPQWRRES